jgi:predicted permease
LTTELPSRYPVAYTPQFLKESGFSPNVQALQAAVVGSSAKTLWILFGAVAVVLLIAGANVANLFLLRAETRRNEIAIRNALGAERAHLFIQSLAESMTIAVVAGLGGVWLAYGALQVLISVAPTTLPRLEEVHLDSSALLFAAAITIAAGLLFAIFPLVRLRFDYGPLREGGRGLTASRAQLRVRSALVALQVALAIVLLSAAGLMLRSFAHMLAVETGMDETNVLAIDVVLPFQAYSTHEVATQYWQTLSAEIEALPGVTHVGGGLSVPLDGGGFGCAMLQAKPAPANYTGCIPNNIITPGFFEALGVRVRGRVPTWADLQSGTGAIVITEALAKYLWPNQDPIGKGVRVPQNELDVYYQVVGVAEDIRSEGVDRPAPAMVFYPVKPIEGAPLWQARNAMTVLVRTSMSNPEQVAPAVRRIAQQLERGAAIGDVRTMEQVVSRSMSGTSFNMMLLGVAGVMALLISVVGLYGVIAYTVSRRRSELGIRMALGAARSDVGGMVVMQSIRLAAIGVTVGLFATLFTAQMLASMLFGVKPTDPLTLTSVSFLLLFVAAVAAFLPAWRASSVSPVEALKS